MTLDDAGFRTLDSVVRAKQVFGQQRLTIITDRFHCYRAVFLARHYGLDAVAFPSRRGRMRYSATVPLPRGAGRRESLPGFVRAAYTAQVPGRSHRGPRGGPLKISRRRCSITSGSRSCCCRCCSAE